MKREIITIENGVVSLPATDIWMTQHQIADLFGCFVSKVNTNIRSILKTGVLDEDRVCHLHHYDSGSCIELYGLEVIIALAYRISSYNADLLREWIIKKMVTKTSEMHAYICWNSCSSLN